MFRCANEGPVLVRQHLAAASGSHLEWWMAGLHASGDNSEDFDPPRPTTPNMKTNAPVAKM